jgi:hypothetical protein
MPALSGSLELKPAGPGDAALLAQVHNANHPDDLDGPEQIRLWLTNPGLEWEMFRVEEMGQPAGYAVLEHAPWSRDEGRHAELHADLQPLLRTAENLGGLLCVPGGASRRPGRPPNPPLSL